MRKYLVIGSSSTVGSAVVSHIQNIGGKVIRIDAHGGDINVDFSTTAGRLEAIEKVLEFDTSPIDGIISTIKTSANKPISISMNFFGITQFIEGLYDELKKSDSPRICILNYYESCDETSAELVESMLHSNEKKSLKIAQQILELTPALAYQTYTSSQMALKLWVQEVALKWHWKRRGILINTVNADHSSAPTKLAELLVWLASPANQTHTGEVFSEDQVPLASTAPNHQQGLLNNS